MGRVRICDRCGKYYPSYENKANVIGLTTFNMNNEQVSSESYNDVCPECMEEYNRWFFGPSYDEIPREKSGLDRNAILNRMFNVQLPLDEE